MGDMGLKTIHLHFLCNLGPEKLYPSLGYIGDLLPKGKDSGNYSST